MSTKKTLIATLTLLLLICPSRGLSVHAEDVNKNIADKWHARWNEYQARGFTIGTLDEYVGDWKFKKDIIHARTARSLLFTSRKYPKTIYVLCQVRSIQGHWILLGPEAVADIEDDFETYQKHWKVAEPDIRFDETRHYSGRYMDQRNRAMMFVIWEKRPGGDVPIQALVYPRRVTNPNLVDEKRNNDEKWARWIHSVIPFVKAIGEALLSK